MQKLIFKKGFPVKLLLLVLKTLIKHRFRIAKYMGKKTEKRELFLRELYYELRQKTPHTLGRIYTDTIC